MQPINSKIYISYLYTISIKNLLFIASDLFDQLLDRDWLSDTIDASYAYYYRLSPDSEASTANAKGACQVQSDSNDFFDLFLQVP